MGSEKKALEFEGQMDLQQVVAYLEDLVKGLKSGSTTLSRGDHSLVLSPGGTIDLAVTAKAKREKESLSIKLKWMMETPQKSAPPFEIRSNGGDKSSDSAGE